MEPKVIARMLKRANENVQEVKTLYEITETEQIFMTYIIIESSGMGLSAKLTAKLLKAAAHFLESSEELYKDFIEDNKK